MRTRILLMTLAVSAAPLLAEELVLDVDPAQSHVQFTLGATLHTVHGSFKMTRGAVRLDSATGRIAGQLVASATSGETGDQSRDQRMHRDILESARYPEIVFTPDRVDGAIAAQGTSRVQVHGTFLIHGAAHEISVPVEVTRTGARTTAMARFQIPYVKWGLKNPSTLLLRVSDKVEIVASLSTQ